MHHGEAVVALHEKIILVGKAQACQLVPRAQLRLLARQLVRGLLRVPGLDEAMGDFDEVFDLLLAILDEDALLFGQTEPRHRGKHGKEHRQEQRQPLRDRHPFHHEQRFPRAPVAAAPVARQSSSIELPGSVVVEPGPV